MQKPSEPSKRAALRGLLALLALGGAAALCVLSYRSAAGKAWLFCPQFRFTGLYCPGCGTMRALGCLLAGRFREAFASNPLSALLLPCLFVLGLCWLTGWTLTGRDLILWRVPAWIYWTLLAALLLFGILRNIPLLAFDCLRPPG